MLPIEFCVWLVTKARSRLYFIVFGRGVAWGWVARRRYGGLQRAARDISCVLLLLPSRPFSGDRRLQNTRASTQKGVSLCSFAGERAAPAASLRRCLPGQVRHVVLPMPKGPRSPAGREYLYTAVPFSADQRRPSANYG